MTAALVAAPAAARAQEAPPTVTATTPAGEAVLAASQSGSTFRVKLAFTPPSSGTVTGVAVNVAHVGVRSGATDHLLLRPDANGFWAGTTSKALPPGRYWWWIDIDWTVPASPDGVLTLTLKSGTVRRWFSVVRAPGRDCGTMTLGIDDDGAATAESIRAQGLTCRQARSVVRSYLVPGRTVREAKVRGYSCGPDKPQAWTTTPPTRCKAKDAVVRFGLSFSFTVP